MTAYRKRTVWIVVGVETGTALRMEGSYRSARFEAKEYTRIGRDAMPVRATYLWPPPKRRKP